MSVESVGRRPVLATIGGVALAGLAGCSSVTEQSFEAAPVALPEGARDELVLAETARESLTLSREGPSGDVEVTITNHTAAYRRGPARGAPTLVERFVSSVNGTPGSGAAISIRGGEAGLSEPTLSFRESGGGVDPDALTLLVPEDARDSNNPFLPEQTVALMPGAALDRDTITYDGDGPGAFFPSDAYFPSCTYFPSETYFPSCTYFPSDIYSPGSPDEFRTFVANVESMLEQAGMDALPDGAERVDPGQTVEVSGTVFGCQGNDIIVPNGEFRFSDDVFDRGTYAALGGTPFGLGALATPSASIADQEANPLVAVETAELLELDAAKQVLAQTGLTDGDTIEWLAGPTAAPDFPGPEQVSLLGTETELESFRGVVSGGAGPWGVSLRIARITEDDHVVAATGVARPVGTVEGGTTAVEGSGWGMDVDGETFSRASEFSAAVIEAVERT